jgi:type VI secretion system protein ImpA
VTVYLIRSLVHTNGIFGLRDGLALLKALLERFWDSIHPGLDPSDREDPIMRLNALNGLADYNSILVSVKSAPLVDTRGIGQFSLRDIEGADDPDKPGPSMSDIGAAFMGCDLEDLKATKEAVDEAIEFVAAIEHLYGEHVGEGNSLGLEGLVDQLRAIQVALADRLAQRGVDEKLTDEPGANEVMSVDAGDGARPTTGRIGGINGHADVVRALDAICDYYNRNEPSSPVPLLLKRAKRLVAKGFMEILRDIAPDGTSQAELIRGAEEETDERD